MHDEKRQNESQAVETLSLAIGPATRQDHVSRAKISQVAGSANCFKLQDLLGGY